MKPLEFFIEEEDPEWDLHGLNPERRWRPVFNAELINDLRSNPQAGASDVEAAYGLVRLAHEELLEYGTSGNYRLTDEEIAAVLRCLRAVLKRLGVTFDPPFRDFKGFHGYWSKEGMGGGGGWAARRGYLSGLFSPLFSRLDELEDEQAAGATSGASTGSSRT